MKTRIISLAFYCLLLAACNSQTDDLLLNRLDVDYLVNPIVGNITTGDEVRAWLIGDSSIIGFGGDYAFYTNNDFDSLYSVTPNNATLKSGTILYNDFENIVLQQAGDDLYIEETNDYGQTYSPKIQKSRFEERSEGGVSITGTHSFDAAAFAGIDIGWVFSRYTALSGSDLFPTAAKVYNIVKNGSTGETSIIHIADLPAEYAPISANFFNALSGYLLTRSSTNSNNYVFVTGDGGFSWEGPFIVGNTAYNMQHIALSDPQNLYIYSKDKIGIYASHDGGMTWQYAEPYLANLSHYGVLDLYVVNQQVAYAALARAADDIATIGDVFRTDDGGNTWTKANQAAMYAEYIDCIDAHTCIATSKNVVQITRDGGATWKVLVYPL